MRHLPGLIAVVAAAVLSSACGGATATVSDAGADGASSGSSGGSGGSSGSSGGSSGGSGGSSGSSSGGSSGGSSSGPADGGRPPSQHRANDDACSLPAPPGNCASGAPGMCSKDSECTAGVNGRCVQSGGDALECACTYDACAHDTDCPGGQTCECRGSPFSGAEDNTCVPGNCRVDADCGSGGYCSPSLGMVDCGGQGGYYCHTASDQCVDSSDCASGEDCNYSTSDGRWICQQELVCG